MVEAAKSGTDVIEIWDILFEDLIDRVNKL